MQRSTQLVIDASVARAAGDELATYPTSVHCRNFLETVYHTRKRIVMTRAIAEEWKTHASRFTRAWEVNMRRFNRIIDKQIGKNTDLRHQIDYAQVQHEQHRAAMHKDCHLLEAALETDKRIASLDEEVRTFYHALARQVAYLQAVVWVNPCKEEEECVQWLKEDAKNDPFRCLGYQEE